MTTGPAISFQAVAFGYHGSARPVLDGFTAAFAPGRVTAVVGPNGCGKSTGLRLALGLLRPDSGSVSIAGASDPASIPEPERARRLVSVPQRSAPAFGYTALEVASMGAPRTPSARARELAASALDRVGLAQRAGDRADELSAGQQQRVTLARALTQIEAAGQRDGATRVQAVLADEPTSAMDPRHALEALTLLRSLAESGPAVVLVLHDLALAARFADDALVMADDGSVAAAGPAKDVLRPETLGPVFGVGFEASDLPLSPVLTARPTTRSGTQATEPAPSR